MELKIEQELQQAVAAHKEGKLQEAERLYRTILQFQSNHPDANHNLGVLAVSINKVEEALTLFKTALEANPKTEQFWLSYIDLLIKEKQFNNARQLIEQGKNQGVDVEKLSALESQLLHINQKTNVISASPSQQKIRSLSEHYQNGRFNDAEKLALSLTQEFPKHQFGWKALGAVFEQSGRHSEALRANQKSVEITPQDAEAHNNLGNTLKELGRLDEAEESLRQAIVLNSNYAEAHNNLGVAIKELGRLDEAEASLKQAIRLKPEFAEAHYNLGNTLQELGRLHESILCFKKAIELKSDYIDARINLNIALSSAVPNWHFAMMNDEGRNNAYFSAIKLAIDDGSFVLEIGTGSGLLSMMAVANGAEKVVTCETSRTLAETAKKIIDSNGYREKISVVNKKSTDLIIGEDLPQRADVVISEILSSEFVGEGVRSTILDANKRLLKKSGRMIPQSGSIRISLLGNNEEVSKALSVSSVHGYDLSEFNLISQSKINLKLKDKPLLLSNPEDAFTINLNDKYRAVKEEKIIQLHVNQNGSCLGLIQWLWINLYKDIEYENRPGENDTHWSTPIYLFDKPVSVKMGDVLEIRAVLGEDNVWFYRLT